MKPSTESAGVRIVCAATNASQRNWRKWTSAAAAVLALSAMTIIIGLHLARHSVADTIPAQSAIDVAMANALSVVLTNPAPPMDAEGIRQSTAAAFSFLYPALATQQRRTDPAFAAAEARALAVFTNAVAFEAELTKDDQLRQFRDLEFGGLMNMVDTTEPWRTLVTNRVRSPNQRTH